jgi:hypothetical protein
MLPLTVAYLRHVLERVIRKYRMMMIDSGNGPELPPDNKLALSQPAPLPKGTPT